MTQFIIKHETRPATWARVEAEKNGGEVVFSTREKATAFPSRQAALAVFEKASAAM